MRPVAGKELVKALERAGEVAISVKNARPHFKYQGTRRGIGLRAGSGRA